MPFTPRAFPQMRTLNLKYCVYCGEMQDWPLDEGQQPIGYCVDPDLAGILGEMGQDIGGNDEA